MEKKSFMKKLTGSREALLAVILVLLFVVITIISPSFLTFKSLTDMLKNNAVTMVMSLGMLCVMLVGGIDISIMSTLALTGMSIGMLLKYEHISSTFLAFVIALAIGIACAAALGKFKDFATTKFLGMSLVIWVIILCYVIFFVFMKWTTIGRRIYAVGSNPSAAEVSGINVKNIKLLVCTENIYCNKQEYQNAFPAEDHLFHRAFRHVVNTSSRFSSHDYISLPFNAFLSAVRCKTMFTTTTTRMITPLMVFSHS